MNPISMAGILLVVLGVLALIHQEFGDTHREKVFDVGPIHATADERKEIPIPPIFGGLALAGGVALLVMGARRRV